MDIEQRAHDLALLTLEKDRSWIDQKADVCEAYIIAYNAILQALLRHFPEEAPANSCR